MFHIFSISIAILALSARILDHSTFVEGTQSMHSTTIEFPTADSHSIHSGSMGCGLRGVEYST